MQTKATIKPGQNGTKRMMEKYGKRLVCVRYRYDHQQGKRYTTVELIEDEQKEAQEEGKSPAQSLVNAVRPPTVAQQQRLAVKVGYREAELRSKIKAAGAIWRPRHRLWEMRYEDVVALGLQARVVADDATAAEL